DRPLNAITLTHYFHDEFGKFEIFFEPYGDQPHTYQIKSVYTGLLCPAILPVVRTLFLTDTRTIDPPSPRLLAIHRAIAHILHLSGAGGYIERILRDLDEGEVVADGSTPLGHIAQLRLQGWWDGRVSVF